MMKRTVLIGAVALAVVLAPAVGRAFTTSELEAAGLSFVGYFELLLEHQMADAADKTDLTISSAEFGAVYAPDDWASVHVLLHYDQGIDATKLWEGFVELGGTETVPVIVKAGRFFLPLGGYSSLFCQDPLCSAPLSKVITETKEEAIQVGYAYGLVQFKAGIANGDVQEIGSDDDLNLYYGNVEMTPMEGVTLGLAYTSDVANSDTISGLVPEEGIVHQVPGVSAFAIYEQGPFYARLDYVTATKRFALADLDTDADGVGDEPSAWAIVLAYDVTEQITLGAMYGQADEFVIDEQYGLAVNYTVYSGVVVGVEYVHGLLCCGPDSDTIQGRLKVSF
ncbi:MAG: LbtU family siderophore porin [Verrucomicrobia bacterium]|nr:LbtU family siderophore porin [Verrucomicrobiota bacterium]